jgi:putative transposase
VVFDPAVHHRRSIRLKHFDYTMPGAYFVTICASEGEMLFGEIGGGQMRMNELGQMVHDVWHAMPKHYAAIKVDAFVVMPNHVHGVIWIVGAGPRARPQSEIRQQQGRAGAVRGWPEGPAPKLGGQAQGPAPTISLPDAVHRFKSLTTARYRQGVGAGHWPSCGSVLWQRNYYEHIIRDDKEVNRIREYILANPQRWRQDPENPAREGEEEDFDLW